MKAASDEVLIAEAPIVDVGSDDVEELKRRARGNARQRIRLCAHRDVDDPVHEMLIVHMRGTYVRPHKHLRKSESFHVVEGTADVVLFDDAGDLLEVIRMGEYWSRRRFYYRLSEPRYHTVLITSDTFVFHETANGPFRRAETVFAPWAPEDGDAEAARAFVARMESRVEEFFGVPRGAGERP